MSAEGLAPMEPGPAKAPNALSSDGAIGATPRMALRDRVGPLVPIAIFDVAGPLAVYYGARSAGLSTVVALVVSGILPAVRVVATIVRRRRLDSIGALVLSGIVLGTVAGLASGSARVYLLDGIVPTVVLGVVCLVSLMSSRPMMFRIALETMGEDSPKGRQFADMWSHSVFRRTFQVITVVWGVMFLVESVVQAVIIETASIDTAKNTSNLLPIAAVVLTFAWTRAYGERAGQRGERLSKDEGASRQPSLDVG